MKFLSIVLGILLAPMALAEDTPTKENNRTIAINAQMSKVELSVRDAAVKVTRTDRPGHGSGSLVQYKDLQLVFTAQHVANTIVGTTYRIIHDNEVREAILVYSNAEHDIAILWMQLPWPRNHAMKWDPTSRIPEVGTQITYSGYPAAHNLMTYRGRVAGYELMPDGSTNILLHTYGYFGCSGSVIYNTNQEIVGILWGIDADRRRSIPVEDMIWVSPVQNLNIDLSLRGLCQTLRSEPRACR